MTITNYFKLMLFLNNKKQGKIIKEVDNQLLGL